MKQKLKRSFIGVLGITILPAILVPMDLNILNKNSKGLEDEKAIKDAQSQITPEQGYIDLKAPQKKYLVANYANGKSVDFYETRVHILQDEHQYYDNDFRNFEKGVPLKVHVVGDYLVNTDDYDHIDKYFYWDVELGDQTIEKVQNRIKNYEDKFASIMNQSKENFIFDWTGRDMNIMFPFVPHGEEGLEYDDGFWNNDWFLRLISIAMFHPIIKWNLPS